MENAAAWWLGLEFNVMGRIFTALIILSTFAVSCSPKTLPKECYPPSVTLIKGKTYEFKECVIEGRGERLYSEQSYVMTLLTGRPANF